MTKAQILNISTEDLYKGVLEYFDIRELVSPGAYKKYKHFGDNFFLSRFDRRLLQTILWVRIKKGKSITVNTWLWNGIFDERGIRDTSTPMVQKRATRDDSWLSGHVLAMALDYDVEGETAEEHRNWLLSVQEELPHPIRLEHKLKGKPITWVHLDVCDDPKNPKVYLFDI
jgi:hypothetical protein